MGLVLLLRKVDNKIKISEGCEEMDGIGYVLRNLRLNKGLTQKYIYKNLCSRKQLSRIENNTSYPSVYLLYYIFQRLEVTTDYVISLTLERGNHAK
ncbi:MAG: helix-turn-helix transcriptional regulator [Streptococcus mitis]|nr:helix-turn-helix transcriptional regulator [Streptococcus mitis]